MFAVTELYSTRIGVINHSGRRHGYCLVRATGASLPCGRYLLAPLTGNKDGSKAVTAPRVRPTPNRFPINISLVDGTLLTRRDVNFSIGKLRPLHYVAVPLRNASERKKKVHGRNLKSLKFVIIMSTGISFPIGLIDRLSIVWASFSHQSMLNMHFRVTVHSA